MAGLLTKTARTVERCGLIPAGSKVLVAVSGGADSTALLHVLARLSAERQDFTLEVAHLDHGLRGEQSAGDARFVAEMTRGLGLACHLERLSAGSLKRRGVSPQEAAREARLAFLERVAEDVGAARIALGHTADDRAEETLMRLLSGAGARGLSGMRPRRGRFIRPLIECRRAEVEEWLRAQGLAWREDASNLSADYLRNRIRHELLPHLEAAYNPNLRESLLRQADLLGDEDDLLEGLALVRLEEMARFEPGVVALPAAALAEEHPAMQRRVLRLACQRLAGSLRGVGFRHIEALRSLAASRSPSAGALSLPGGLRAERRYAELLLRRAASAPRDWELALPGPGRYQLPETGACLTLRLTGDGREDEALFDAAQVRWPLTVRGPRRGDRFQPRGMKGTKAVFRLLSDAKVPRAERWRVPILVSAGNIIWVGGLRCAEHGRPREGGLKLAASLEPAARA